MSRTSSFVRSAAAGLVALSGIGLAACQAPPVVPPPPPPPVATACASSSPAITCSQFTVDGLPRKIYAHVSAQPAPAGGRPLVLWFHGDGGTGNVNLASLYAQTDPDGAVVVQLDGPNTIASLGRGSTAWSFRMDGDVPDDVHFTKTVIDDVLVGSLVPGANVNPSRVYAMGSSRGGFMVDTLLVDARTAGSIAAVVNLSGNFYCEDGDAVCDARVNGAGFSAKASILHIHGDADGVVPPPARLPNPVTQTISWPWPLGQFAYANGCTGNFAYTSQLSPSMSAKPTYLYTGTGGCGIDYRLVLVQNGGHGISGWEAYGWGFAKTKTLA
jgi:poly(3-hydroxybutyrate) depolymerase